MKASPISRTLGKIIIAAAWSGGELTLEERECVKDLLFQLPELSDTDWGFLEALLSAPTGLSEKKQIVNEVCELLRYRDERELCIYALDRVLKSEGLIQSQERCFIAKMQETVFNSEGKFASGINRLMKMPLLEKNAVQEKRLEGVNRLNMLVSERVADLSNGRFSVNMSERELRKLFIAGMLMARVVQADEVIDDKQVSGMMAFIKERWELTTDEAQFVIVVSLSEQFSDLDFVRICRWYYELTNQTERIHFLDVLFKLGCVDGYLSQDEVDEIINITAHLKLQHNHFHEAFMRAN